MRPQPPSASTPNASTPRASRLRSAPFRAAAALLAAWLLVVFGAPPTLHPCPVHDGSVVTPLPVASAHEPCADAHAAHRAHGSHDAHGSHGAHGCSCLGACCAAPAAFVAAPLVSSIVVASVARDVAPIPVDARRHPDAPEHARPPSIGPPVRALG